MFNFANPWLLLTIPLPLLVHLLLPSAKPRNKQALKIPFFDQISRYPSIGLQKNQLPRWPFLIACLIWLLLVIATAQPQWIGRTIPTLQRGRDIMLAVDLSGSMKLPDMVLAGRQVNRLVAIKVVAGQFIEQRVGDRVGLIVFGSKAYLQAPLTFDRKTVKQMLDDTSIGLVGSQTAIGDAIGLAIKRLKMQRESQRLLILLTDGANNSGVTDVTSAAQLAAEHKVRIYTIGFGAETLNVPGLFRTEVMNPSLDLDEKSLKSIAQITGGQYFRAKDIKSLQAIYQHLNKIEPISADKSFYRPQQSLFAWPLSIAFLLSLGMAIKKYHLLKTPAKPLLEAQTCNS
jgi:Ca-activated chloride channel homolog